MVMEGDGLPAQVATALAGMPSNAKAALIEVLAARAADKHLDVVLAEVKSTDPAVRTAAYAALPSLVDDSDLPKLFALMNSTDDKEQAGQVQDATISALGNAGDAKTQAAHTVILLNQLKKAGAGKKSWFLRIMVCVVGPKTTQPFA